MYSTVISSALSLLGESATYSHDGAADISMYVLMSERSEFDAGTVYAVESARIARSDVDTPYPGDTMTIGATTYTVVQLLEQSKHSTLVEIQPT